jgi:hypothetical protein
MFVEQVDLEIRVSFAVLEWARHRILCDIPGAGNQTLVAAPLGIIGSEIQDGMLLRARESDSIGSSHRTVVAPDESQFHGSSAYAG